jgi:hypothetical protein
MILDVEISDEINVTGTSLQGYVEATYEELVDVFGKPTHTYGDKTTCEWDMEFRVETGDDIRYVVATLYDWKMAPTVNSNYRWHIGGKNYLAVECVTQAIQGVRDA